MLTALSLFPLMDLIFLLAAPCVMVTGHFGKVTVGGKHPGAEIEVIALLGP